MAEIQSDKKITVTNINIRQSIFILLFKLVLLDVISLVMVVAFFSLVSAPFFHGVNDFILSTNGIYFSLLVIIKIGITFYVVLEWLNEYYEIHPDSVIHRSGIIWRKESRYPLRQIRLIKMEQGIFGRIFNYGTIDPYDWDLSKYASMYMIHNPIKYLKILENLAPRASGEKESIREHLIREEEKV